jgi:hypothetical protein
MERKHLLAALARLAAITPGPGMVHAWLLRRAP